MLTQKHTETRLRVPRSCYRSALTSLQLVPGLCRDTRSTESHSQTYSRYNISSNNNKYAALRDSKVQTSTKAKISGGLLFHPEETIWDTVVGCMLLSEHKFHGGQFFRGERGISSPGLTLKRAPRSSRIVPLEEHIRLPISVLQ